MTLIKKHEVHDYHDFVNENELEGMCLSMSVSWILDRMDVGNNYIAPPRGTQSLKGVGLYDTVFDMVFSDRDIVERLEWIGKQLTYKRPGAKYKVKAARYDSGKFKNFECVGKTLNSYLSTGGGDVFCILVFRTPGGICHGVALFQCSITKECYFYDPDNGVYQWIRTGMGINHEIQEVLSKDLTEKGVLTEGVFVR
uniref:hypothetical protein n=1 Tax=Serratia quinivorans TaxID=137545 RepID=UPI0035C742AB